jgi:hypothetical protein
MVEEMVGNILLVSEIFWGDVWFMEWIQDCWWLVCDGEAVDDVFLIGCVLCGGWQHPPRPPAGGANQ